LLYGKAIKRRSVSPDRIAVVDQQLNGIGLWASPASSASESASGVRRLAPGYSTAPIVQRAASRGLPR
jgi:hypothetical protein